MRRRIAWVVLAAAGLLFFAGVLCQPNPRIAVDKAPCHLLEQDDLPWIYPAKRGHTYCEVDPPERYTRRSGSFELLRADPLAGVDDTFWDRLDSTFQCNLAVFSPDHVVDLADGGVRFALDSAANDKGLASGSIATKDVDEAKFTYGRFEVVLKPAKASGVITAFFLYRFDPWQEIDAEILGKDPTQLLVNVYYNPGDPGDLYNYGYRGTPVLIDLGFDASKEFHRYTVEWEPAAIRWFVDGRLVHVRKAGRPTPIPHLPMRFHVNLWPCCSEELAGPFDPAVVPTGAEVASVRLSSWKPSLGSRIRDAISSYFSPSDDDREWRAHDAAWIHP